MGQTMCCKEVDKDGNAMNLQNGNSRVNLQGGNKSQTEFVFENFSTPVKDFNKEIMLKDALPHEKKIIFLQAAFRGHLTRNIYGKKANNKQKKQLSARNNSARNSGKRHLGGSNQKLNNNNNKNGVEEPALQLLKLSQDKNLCASGRKFENQQNNNNFDQAAQQQSNNSQICNQNLGQADPLKIILPADPVLLAQQQVVLRDSLIGDGINSKNDDGVIQNGVDAAQKSEDSNQNFFGRRMPPAESELENSRPLNEVPDYSNEATREAEERMGPFDYAKFLLCMQQKDSSSVPQPNLIERGPVELSNGAIYKGNWSDLEGHRHGQGYQIWRDGSKYEGFWSNDMANGYGRLIHSNGDVYEGEWFNDKAHGQGIYYHKDGARYEGEWCEDKQHGCGIETWPDGARYEGSFQLGKKHGHGTFQQADKSTFIGEFANNNIHGRGIYAWVDGRKYEGEWKNNRMHGKGTFTWSDGRRYYGEYAFDKKNGYGEFVWPDGSAYKGDWLDGKQHGVGMQKTANGQWRYGTWNQGRRVRVANRQADQPA